MREQLGTPAAPAIQNAVSDYEFKFRCHQYGKINMKCYFNKYNQLYCKKERFVQSLSSLYSLRDNAVIENLAIDYIIVSNCDTLLDADGFL